MRQAKLPLKIGQFGIAENSVYTMDLPRQYDYNSLFLTVAGSITNTVAFAGGIRPEAPSQIIKRVDLIADGTIIVQSWSGQQLLWGNFDRIASLPGATAAQLAVAPGATAAVHPFSFSAVVDFDSVRSIRPKDTAFRTNALTQWQLRVTFGVVADLYNSGAGAGTITSGTVTVSSVQTVEYPDGAGKTSNPAFVKRVSLQSYSIPSSNSALEFRLNTGNLIKAVSIRTSVNGNGSDGLINNIQLSAAQDVRCALSGGQLAAQHLYNYGAPLKAGYYLLDFTENGQSPGRLADSWDVTSKLLEPKLILDVTGGAGYSIDVATVEIQPILYR